MGSEPFGDNRTRLWRTQPGQTWLGVGAIAAAQIVFQTTRPLLPSAGLVTWIDQTLRLDIGDPVNPLLGLALTCIGLSLLVPVFRRSDTSGPGNECATPPPAVLWTDLARWPLVGAIALWSGLIALIVLRDPAGEPTTGQVQTIALEITLWLGAILLATLAVWRTMPRCEGPGLTRHDWAFLLVAIGIALGVAAYRLGDLPRRLVADEPAFLVLAAKIIRDGAPSLFGFGVYSFPVLSSFWQAGFLWAFGTGYASWRLASIVPGLLAAIPLYGLATELFGRRIARMAVPIYLTLPYVLALERLGYNNSQSLPFIVAMLWCAQRGVDRGQPLWFWWSGLIGGAAFYTYPAARVGWVIVALAILSQATTRRSEHRQAWMLAILLWVGGGILGAGPHLAYGMAHHPENLTHKALESFYLNRYYVSSLYSPQELAQAWALLDVAGHQLVLDPPIALGLLARGLLRTALALIATTEPGPHFMIGAWPGSPIAVGFFLVGSARVLALSLRDRRFGLILWMGALLVGLSVLNSVPPRGLHLAPIMPAFAVVMALGIDAVARWWIELLVALRPIRHRITATWQHNLAGLGVCGLALSGVHQYYAIAAPQIGPDVDNVIHWIMEEPRPPFAIVQIGQTLERVPFSIGLFHPEVEVHTIFELVPTSAASLPDTHDAVFYSRRTLTPSELELLAQTYPDLGTPTQVMVGDVTTGTVLTRGTVRISAEPTCLTALAELAGSPGGVVAISLSVGGLTLAARRRGAGPAPRHR